MNNQLKQYIAISYLIGKSEGRGVKLNQKTIKEMGKDFDFVMNTLNDAEVEFMDDE